MSFSDDPLQSQSDPVFEVGWDKRHPFASPVGKADDIDTLELIKRHAKNHYVVVPKTPPLLSLWLKSPHSKTSNEAVVKQPKRLGRQARLADLNLKSAADSQKLLAQLTSFIAAAKNEKNGVTTRSTRSFTKAEEEEEEEKHNLQQSFEELWTDDELFDSDSFLQATQSLAEASTRSTSTPQRPLTRSGSRSAALEMNSMPSPVSSKSTPTRKRHCFKKPHEIGKMRAQPAQSPSINNTSLTDDLLATLAEPDDCLDSQLAVSEGPIEILVDLNAAKEVLFTCEALAADHEEEGPKPALNTIQEEGAVKGNDAQGGIGREVDRKAPPTLFKPVSSTQKCTPQEVERKRQEALRRKRKSELSQISEATQLNSTAVIHPTQTDMRELIERKRQEAIRLRKSRLGLRKK